LESYTAVALRVALASRTASPLSKDSRLGQLDKHALTSVTG
jgi:hypothetical protein